MGHRLKWKMNIKFPIFFPKTEQITVWTLLFCMLGLCEDTWLTFAAWVSLKDLTNRLKLFLVLKHLYISCLWAPGSCNLQAAHTWLRYDQRESSFPPGLKSLLAIWHPAAGWALCCRCCASGIVKHSYDLSFGRCFSIQEEKRRGSARRWRSRRESTN